MNLANFIRRHHLPAEYADSVERCYLPFIQWLEKKLAAQPGETYVLGINGAQGTGKSTLARLIDENLAASHDYRIAILSIDDLYLTRSERALLAQMVHPMLRTRGVPGTHDVALGLSVIEQLRSLQADENALIPRFDKSRDDRCPENAWSDVSGPVDLLIFEGWCVASQPQSDSDLQRPVNALESRMDPDGRWRRYVNNQLRGDYAELFAMLDCTLFLQAPSFAAIRAWRMQQEHELQQSAAKGADAIMSDAQIGEFIQYYERVSQHNLVVLPGTADAVIKLGTDHQATSLVFAKE